MKARGTLTGQEGFTLIEVLVATISLGIAIVGLTLLLSRGQAAVVAQGDTRIALYLAQQKVERLRGLGFSTAKVADRVTTGCLDPTANNEPCYNETIQAGAGQQTPTTTQVDTQTFTRLTCVRIVQDDDPEQPADPPATSPFFQNPNPPPSSWTCQSCTAAVIDPGTGTCTANCNCTNNTRRIKVAVIPTLLGNAGASTAVDPNRVTLETVLTPTAKP